MTKRKGGPKINELAAGLAILAVAFEVVNVIYSLSVHAVQANACPRDPLPPQISMMLVVASALTIIIASLQTKNKGLYVSFALFYIAIIGCVQYFLLFYSNGGINWCNFVF